MIIQKGLNRSRRSYQNKHLEKLQTRKQWCEPPSKGFFKQQRGETTILFGGLTRAHDFLLEGALRRLGYRVQHLDEPDLESLRLGKEFGNRGQCNPAYFTAGNLIKYLQHLHLNLEMSKEEIIQKYVFFTIGSCGPCRFGAYITEYRNALRNADFPGFRVIVMHKRGLEVSTDNQGITVNLQFILAVLRAIFLGDALNAMGYRIRPYEVQPGSTDRVLEQCKQILHDSLSKHKSLLPALLQCRRQLSSIKVNWAQVKPKVSVIGEFWATTTEGDGNYHIQRFLEQEGAEVQVQPVTAWVLYTIWVAQEEHRKRLGINSQQGSTMKWGNIPPPLRTHLLQGAEWAIRAGFKTYARLLGLKGYHLPNMKEMARVATPFYDQRLRGGEGHMEVGKVILNTTHQKATMTLSVKPFGCMPSSGVSDGIQSLVIERYPDAVFLPIETTGDSIVNVQSRIQMILFKAKQLAQKEYQEALQHTGLTEERIEQLQGNSKLTHALNYPRHRVACTMANKVYHLARCARPPKVIGTALDLQ